MQKVRFHDLSHFPNLQTIIRNMSIGINLPKTGWHGMLVLEGHGMLVLEGVRTAPWSGWESGKCHGMVPSG